MRIQAQALSLPKAGNGDAENEDAWWCDPLGETDLPSWRCAVADGATETSFSRLWARMLVRAFARRRLEAESLAESLPALQRGWLRLAARRALSWYAEQKLEEGAHAAFVGLELFQAGKSIAGGTWRAWALGDACLFRVTAGWELAEVVPPFCAEDFGSRPHLLSSRPAHAAQTLSHLMSHEAPWRAGDVFFLLTDALAAWFLRQVEAKRHPWKELEVLVGNPADFAEWVKEQRRGGTLRNDDVTAVCVQIN